MLIYSHQSGLTALKTKYNEEVKPLVAQVEAVYEKTPEQLLNEIRSFADHEARCYRDDITSPEIEKELDRAEGHLTRVILDCFKYLNVMQHKIYVERFTRIHYFINLNLVDSGNFIVKYHVLVKAAEKAVRNAKACESYDKDTALILFQEAYNSYSELEELVENNRRQIMWAGARSIWEKLFSFVGGILTTIIIGLIVYGIDKGYLSDLYQRVWMKFVPPADVPSTVDLLAPTILHIIN